MSRLPRAVFISFLGALICGVLSAAVFSLGAIVDGTRPMDAMAYGVVIGVPGAFFGALIGFIVGRRDLSVARGAITGLMVAAPAIAFFLFVFGIPGQYGYFQGESAGVGAVLVVPMVLTGIFTALFKNALDGA